MGALALIKSILKTYKLAISLTMNFDFSPEQKQIQDQVRRLLDDTCPLSVNRQIIDDAEKCSATTWSALAEMGALGAAIPEIYGGTGLTDLEQCIIAEEIGRALAPIPTLSTLYLATTILMTEGSEVQKQSWLPKIADGSVIATLAIHESDYSILNSGTPAQVTDGVLTGIKSPVPDGDIAHLAIVSAASSEGKISLYLVELNGDATSTIPLEVIDPSKPQSKIEFHRAQAEPIGSSGNAKKILENAYNRAAILLAFEQIGGADRALEMACAYAMEKKSFGRLVGSYQAIKHKLAEVYVKNQLARAHAYGGASALMDPSANLSLSAAGARVSAIDAFSHAAKENLQTHGGIGFTWESDCHFFYKRAQYSALVLGSRPEWKEKILTELEKK